MKKLVLSVVAASLVVGPAVAADVMAPKAPAPMVAVAPATPVFDIAFGGVVMSDYNFRGVSQSNRGPSAGAYIEPQFNTAIGTLYVGLAGYGINWPSGGGFGFSDPSAEIDIYGGWRKSIGSFSIDLGVIYYYYPSELFAIDSDFWEVYAKLGYAFTPDLSVGANIFYTPDLLNYGQFGFGDVAGFYVSGTAKWVLPWKAGDLGSFVSGELGRWFLDNVVVGGASVDPSYTYWNIGLGLTYKAITLDLRYHGTDQSITDCGNFLLVAAANPATRWCNDTFIAAIKFDTTLSALK
jgi:uncharacterized protein (TIGR02001 family)